MKDCSVLSLTLTSGFLFTMLLPLFKKQGKTNKYPQDIYKKIVEERKDIYAKGMILGILLALLTKDPCNFVIVVMGTTFLFHTLHPKSTYMVEHLKTNSEIKTWVKEYRHMQVTWYSLFVAGLLFALILNQSK